MNTPTVKKTPEQIAEAWGKMGVAISATDFRLQAMVQKSLAKIKIPTKTSEIAEAEKLLKELNADYNEIQDERKKVTAKLDSAIGHLMISEKKFKGDEKLGIPSAIKPLTDAIFNLKKQDELDRQKKAWHDDEIKANKELIANHITNHDAECKKKIVDLVDKAYLYALGNGDVKESEVETYIKNVMRGKKATEDNFKITVPAWKSKYTTTEENQEMWDNCAMDVRSPMDYRQDLKDALDVKFEFYNIAVKNKEASLKQSAIDKEEQENKIEKEAKESSTANALSAMAVTHTATPISTHKELKKIYEIEMPENDWSVVNQILAAFVANLDKCSTYIRVKSIYRLTVEQMAESLCKVKNAEPAFEFGSLKFKITEKL